MRDRPYDLGLVARGSRGIDLGARFVVGKGHVIRDGRCERRLPVSLGHLGIGAAKAAQTGDAIEPSENSGEDEALPRLELKESAFELAAFDMRRELDEYADPLGSVVVEEKREFGIVEAAAREVVELALAGEASPFAGGNAAGQDVVNISASESNMRRFYLGRNAASGSCFFLFSISLGVTRPRSDGVMPNLPRRLAI